MSELKAFIVSGPCGKLSVHAVDATAARHAYKCEFAFPEERLDELKVEEGKKE